jgi:hypothetical protein
VAAQRQLIEECWGDNDLTPLLHIDQQRVFQQWMGSTAGRFVLEIGRRWGKTFLLLCIAIMTAGRTKGRVVYGAPTLKHLKEFVLPTFDKIAATAPPHLRPRFNSTNSHIELPRGGWVHLFGCDDQRQADTGVGSDAELAVFDEAGANSVASLLGYIIKSIFRPSLLMTGGRILLGSSPARIPEHEFTVMTEQAEARGAYAHRTIYDNPRLSDAQREDFIRTDAEDEGLPVEEYKATDTFRREYMAERVVDKMLVVLPEWAAKRDLLRVAVARPEFFDGMTVLDPGGADPHGVLLGYWHFQLAKWVIEDELLLVNGENSEDLSEAIKAKEKEHWGTTLWDGTLHAFERSNATLWEAVPEWMRDKWDQEAPRQPRSRWMDGANQILCRNLYELHKMAFIPTAKDNKQAQVNNLRVMLKREEVLLHPRCIHTDRHFRTTTWANYRRETYARRANEHGDLVDCAVYGARNLDRQRNPTPKALGGPRALTAVEKLARAINS